MHSHFKLFKPYGYLSQFINNEQRKSKKKLLGELYDFPEGAMSVGRLDEHSEGLLLITTDGKTSYHVTSTGIEKEYYAQVDGDISDTALKELQQGVSIPVHGEDYITKPCKAIRIDTPTELPERAKKIRDERHGPTSWISITVTEGKFRQIRKMTAQVGFPTLRLVRFRIGNITIEGLNAGDVVPFEVHELETDI